MGYDKFVEVGRIVFISKGSLRGKIAAIITVIDQNRILIDGPCTGVIRQQINLKSVHLTKFKLNISHLVTSRGLKKLWIKEKIEEQWAESNWAKKIVAKERREAMGDYDRYKLMKAKQARSKLMNGFRSIVMTKMKEAKAAAKK